jgi:hypothetical protein
MTIYDLDYYYLHETNCATMRLLIAKRGIFMGGIFALWVGLYIAGLIYLFAVDEEVDLMGFLVIGVVSAMGTGILLFVGAMVFGIGLGAWHAIVDFVTNYF